jgi:hypothetical protein
MASLSALPDGRSVMDQDLPHLPFGNGAVSGGFFKSKPYAGVSAKVRAKGSA